VPGVEVWLRLKSRPGNRQLAHLAQVAEDPIGQLTAAALTADLQPRKGHTAGRLTEYVRLDDPMQPFTVELDNPRVLYRSI